MSVGALMGNTWMFAISKVDLLYGQDALIQQDKMNG
jgi:hypothetical protein|tara:strand:- start:303 stop:410 length:108 start_codon:yes stop_codon:yes gene_type:complete